MATTPTNNPVPSESPRDLKFNAGKVDEFVTSMGWTYTDRFGNKHYTIEGLRWLAQQAISQFGYITLDRFEDGNTLTLPNQVLRLEATGEYYRWDGPFPKEVSSDSTPESTGGIGPGAWLSVGDASLRMQLGNNDGFRLLGECPDVATLRETEPKSVGQLIRVKNYYSDKFGGGGFFRSINPGSLVDDGGLYIKTSGGAVWRRCVKNKQVSTEEYGCWDGNTGSDNSARLLKACASGLDVKMMGENYNVVSIPSSRFSLTGRMKASTTDFSTAYGRTLLTLTGANVTYDIDIDMQNFGAGGFLNLGTDTVGLIKVSNIYGANRTTYGLQNAVSDGGIRNNMSVIVRNIKKGDSGVDPQPAAFTTYGSKGFYPYVDIYDSQGGIIGNSTDESVFGEVIARYVHDNGFYALENSRQTIGTMVCDNVLGEPFVNAGGICTVGTMKLKECQGFGITYSYSGRLRIDHLVLEQTLVSSAMPLLRSRPDNVNSVVSIGKIEGSFVLGGVTASISNSMFAITQGITDLSIGDMNVTLNYVTGSYLGLGDFSACSRIALGNWNITFVDQTGTLTASNIAYFSLPTNAQSTGSKIGLQRYSSSSATVRMTNLSNSTIEVASGQAVQVNVSGAPLITSAISTPSRVFRVTALPTAGKWTSGDILILISPGTTIKYGWSCSQSGDFAGTPPTFQVIA
ncbi:hypothetical protein ACOTXO_09180 [Enterobacter cloacae complex sp. CDL006]|uniref:tail fiber/spike domain-containing protein n=1 Tax=Enterobacter TaxID=547 RepID=UPI0013C2FCE0|nr:MULTISPECIES: hypothetical protein [Enterobacter]MCU2481933.1 hypothetical protein [Enterobacter hormaechei subsp. steigerwaltii]EKW1226057.1 hypothetical protein [Enterobacter hormaechei]EKY3911896.1 hypothetical protein [Enterobacter hormaechei]ELS4571209.1 hypothetical protein [Enterobacter hormaechei]MBK4548648.1 hypothetical protein [Enterobacter hormaechei]